MQISVSGIDRIKERIAKYADLSAKCAELAKRLCEIGEPIIRAAHGGHAVVVAEPIENGYVIRAEGEDILFVEFGAGDATGGYLKGHWHFAGQEIHETEPNPSFYYAYQAMVEALPQIANEVFAA